jgi:hypothetical protein
MKDLGKASMDKVSFLKKIWKLRGKLIKNLDHRSIASRNGKKD